MPGPDLLQHLLIELMYLVGKAAGSSADPPLSSVHLCHVSTVSPLYVVMMFVMFVGFCCLCVLLPVSPPYY